MASLTKKRKVVFWRVTQLIFAIGLCVYLIHLSLSLQFLGDQTRTEQTQMFGYTLTNRAAQDAARYLQEKKPEELERLVNLLAQDPLVRDATIYSMNGEMIHQSKDPMALRTLLNIDKQISSDSARNRIPYIAELYQEKNKIGYLRVTLEQGQYLAMLDKYQQQGSEVLRVMILVALAVGFLLTRALSKKRHWWQLLQQNYPLGFPPKGKPEQ